MITDAGLAQVLYVAQRLREKSREMFVFRADDDPDGLALDIVLRGGLRWCIWHEGLPAAILGAYPMWPGVWGLYGFGTDAYGAVMLTATKHARRVMMPAVAEHAHRAECRSPVGHDDTHRWLQMLGAREEAVLRAAGRNGEDVILFAWVKEMVDG
jgi:hypothetical protein